MTLLWIYLHQIHFLNRGIYDDIKFFKILNQHMKGSSDHMMLLWQALNLELWMCSWIDNQ